MFNVIEEDIVEKIKLHISLIIIALFYQDQKNIIIEDIIMDIQDSVHTLLS